MKTLIKCTYQSETRQNNAWFAIAFAMSIMMITSGCRLVDGSDPGANELILRSIGLEANCSGNAIMAEDYSCEPKLTDASLVDQTQVVWQFSSEHTCSWMQINPITGQVFGSPDRAALGNCVMAVNVIASEKPTDAFTMPIKVSGPKVTFVANNCPLSVAVEQAYDCDYHATTLLKDAVLTWSLAVDNKCAWASIDSATGVVKGSPALGSSGSCVLSINVSVESMTTANLKKTITIPQVPVTITANCPTTLDAGTAFSCAPSANAPVANPKFTWKLSAHNTCAWIQINASTGQITGTPAIHGVGTCIVGFSAQLGSDAATQTTVAVNVRPKGYSELYLLESAGDANSSSGFSVSIDGSWAAVGMPKANNGAGAVLVYQYNGATWLKRATLNSSDPKVKGLGSSVSVSGTTILAGAPNSDAQSYGSGAVLFFDLINGTWTLSQTILGPNKGSGFYGGSVDIDGTQAIVGTSNWGIEAAFVLKRINGVWAHQQDIDFASSGLDLGRVKVAIEGSLAVLADIGAGSTYNGEVRIYRASGGIFNLELVLPAASGSGFGSSLDLANGRILVGAPLERSATGAAYLYENNSGTWMNTKTLRAPDEASKRRFGHSVSLRSGLIAIGSPSSNVAGSAYVYKQQVTDWILDSKLAPAAGQALDNFGGAVAITGTTILVGADLLDTNGLSNTGAAYLYRPR